jgi:hypothetical protein
MDPALNRLLKLLNERDGIPESEQIRRALWQWFAEQGLVKPKQKRS